MGLGDDDVVKRNFLTGGISGSALALALVGGLIWSARTTQKAAGEVKVSPTPVIVYCFIATSIMLWLLL